MKPVLLAAILLMTVSRSALGQPSSATVHTRLTHGRTITITDARGQITTGRVVAVTPDIVTIRKADHPFDVPFHDIVAIDEIDALRNGALVGLVVGSGLFVADVLVSRADGLYLTGAGYVVFGTIYGGLGLAAGAGLDALIGGDRRIYIRGTAARISISPTLTPDRAGALIGISW